MTDTCIEDAKAAKPTSIIPIHTEDAKATNTSLFPTRTKDIRANSSTTTYSNQRSFTHTS